LKPTKGRKEDDENEERKDISPLLGSLLLVGWGIRHNFTLKNLLLNNIDIPALN
jgi:hypothetical protein